MCEADERNQRAIYELRGMATEWNINIPRILQILTGNQCTNQHGETENEPNISATAA